LGERALAAPHPLDSALEQRVLVAAWEVGNRHLAERRVRPEGTAPEKQARARPVERHGRREGELADVRDTGIRADQRRCTRHEVPELGKVEPVAERLEACGGVDPSYQFLS